MAEPSSCAVGRLGPDGAWIGFRRASAGYELVVGLPGHRAPAGAPADSDLLIALAIAHFAEGLDAPPGEIAATHADIAELVRHLASVEPSSSGRHALELALDAIDDGLAADAVIGRLSAALPASVSSDPVALVRTRGLALAGDD